MHIFHGPRSTPLRDLISRYPIMTCVCDCGDRIKPDKTALPGCSGGAKKQKKTRLSSVSSFIATSGTLQHTRVFYGGDTGHTHTNTRRPEIAVKCTLCI